MSARERVSGAGADAPTTSPYAWYVLGVLAVVNAVNYVDRMVLSVLAQPIKADLHLSDTQLGSLTGLAFAIFYGVFGLPVARYADRGVRRNVIAASLAVWSVMTALCGLAQNFWQLFAARVGVGAGEAGALPSCHSIIGDYFPRERRSLAMGVLNAGGLLGMTAGLAVASWIGAQFGWRAALVILMVPGVVVSLLLALTVREPKRGAADPDIQLGEAKLGAALGELAQTRTYMVILAAAAVLGVATYGVAQWLPAFLMRSHGLSLATMGAVYPLAQGTGSLAGALLGGWLADRLSRRDVRGPIYLCVAGYLLTVPLTLAGLYVTSTVAALVLLGLKAFTAGLAVGPIIAAMQNVVAPNRRAFASAVFSFVASLAGFGCGPLLVGVISDGLAASAGSDALRHALAATILLNVPGAILLLWAARSIVRDLLRLQKS